jgi:hypothetical protein
VGDTVLGEVVGDTVVGEVVGDTVGETVGERESAGHIAQVSGVWRGICSASRRCASVSVARWGARAEQSHQALHAHQRVRLALRAARLQAPAPLCCERPNMREERHHIEQEGWRALLELDAHPGEFRSEGVYQDAHLCKHVAASGE